MVGKRVIGAAEMGKEHFRKEKKMRIKFPVNSISHNAGLRSVGVPIHLSSLLKQITTGPEESNIIVLTMTIFTSEIP